MIMRLDLAAYVAVAAIVLIAEAGSAKADAVSMDQIAPRHIAAELMQLSPEGALLAQPGPAMQTGPSVLSVVLQQNLFSGRALVEQTGEGDRSLVVQDNALGGLYAEVHQTAPGAVSDIFQSGSMNSAFVFQTVSAGAYSSISQSGSNNIAIVNQ